MRAKISITAAATMVLVSCLFVQEPAVAQTEQGNTGTSSNPCSTVKTAVIGAVAGALFGKLTHHNVVKGAALGGAVGALACVTINYQSHRTQTAAQVREVAPQAQQSPQATVTSYQLQVNPTNLPAGQPVTVVADMGLLAGTQESIQQIGVRYSLVDPAGKVQQTFTKPVADVSSDGGGYQSTATFTPPAGVPRGSYSVRAELLVNGQPRGEQTAAYGII